jgi:putative transposase
VRLADATPRSAAVAALLLLLHDVAQRGALAEDSRLLARCGAAQKRKKKAPTAAILDSQSVKVSNHGGVRGYDAGKKIMGRKRHLLVDTLGLILAVVVHPANIQDRDGARLVLEKLTHAFGWLRLIWVDGGYAGSPLAQWLKALLPRRGLRREVVKRTELHTFKILPKRWIVERTFGWLMQARRLTRDYETKTSSSEAMILVHASRIMLRRLAKSLFTQSLRSAQRDRRPR